MKKLFIITLVILTALYILPRIKILKEKSFPYTYDQGRDFLKVEEIVKYKNLTFIGPTTGIQGIYHGAWWYYYLSIPYILTNGDPTAFAFWIFISQFLVFLTFTFLIKKEFGEIPVLFFLSLVTFSSYFINMSTFVINSGFTFPFILLFFYSLYKLININRPKYYFLLFLATGFIWEAEFALGIFLLPSLILTFLFLKKTKELVLNKKNLVFSMLGLFIPLSLRIAFELKNDFIQTRTLLNFLIKPKLHNPKPLTESFKERFFQFISYYRSIFPETFNLILAVIFLFLIITTIIYLYKATQNGSYRRFFLANILLIFFLFLLSGFYRDNFWGNYYEGIQLFFIMLISTSVKLILDKKTDFLKHLIIGIYSLLIITGIFSAYNRIKQPFKASGLFIPEYFVKKIYSENQGKEFCVRIYTPPVIPYTWNYLFKYYSRKLNTPEPKSEPVNNTCYFIIEDEAKGYEFRIEEWKKNNVPESSRLIKKEYKYGVTVELREL